MRQSEISRKTGETDVKILLDLDIPQPKGAAVTNVAMG